MDEQRGRFCPWRGGVKTLLAHHPDLTTLSRRLDRMLDPRSFAALERHLIGCLSCRQKLEGMARVKGVLQSLPAPELGAARPIPLAVSISAPALSRWARLGLMGAGGLFLISLVLLRPVQPAMRIISSSPHLVSSQGTLQNPPLLSDTALRSLRDPVRTGHVDLEVPGHLLLRLRNGTTVTWQQVNRSWFSHPKIVVSLMRGEILARTTEKFWGSRLEIRTPTATTFVKGTAFALTVDPSKDSTTVKVLAGSVFFSPYLGNKVGVNVGSGQESRIQSVHLPQPPEQLSSAERDALLEAYRIGLDPPAALVIGGGPERLEELMKPAYLYVTRRHDPELQPFLRKVIARLNAALTEKKDNSVSVRKDLRILEMALESIKGPERVIPLRLFLGAYWVRMGELNRGRAHFFWVADQFPKDPLAPLALAAIGTPEAYQQILTRYPHSPEADLARDLLKQHPR